MRASLLDRAYRSIRSELDRTHEVITTTLRNADAELQQIDRYIYSVPGKMLRPALALLSGLGVIGTKEHADEPVTLAAVFELLHGASLVHDDLIDEENLRRHVGGADKDMATFYAELGISFGRAYQLVDDLIDEDHAIAGSEVAELLESELESLRSRAAGLPQNEYCDGLRTLVDYLLRMARGITDRRTTESSRSRTVDPGRPADGVRNGR